MRTPSRSRPTFPFRYSPLVAALACALGSQVALGAIVANGNDSGAGSLRQVILDANAACPAGGDTITFSGAFTVQIATPLPDILCPNITITANAGGTSIAPVTPFPGLCQALSGRATTPTTIQGLEVSGFTSGYAICGLVNLTSVKVHDNQYGAVVDAGSTIGSSQFYSNANYGVIFNVGTITGSEVYSNAYGIFAGDNSTVTGNSIHDNTYEGLYAASGTVARNNEVFNSSTGISAQGGSTVAGNDVHDNTSYGIDADGAAMVGGPAPSDRNFVYANNTGIYVSYGGTVQNNYVGTADGSNPSPNVTGVEVFSSATISNNVISGNTGNGIEVFDQGGTTIQNNFIGTSATGNAPLGNGGHGIHFNYSYGGAQINGNTIAANGSSGISFSNTGGTTTIGSNMIGVRSDGMAGLGNATGIEADCSTGIYISSNNVISGNSWEGVYFSGVSNSRIWVNKIGVASDGASPIANYSGVVLETSYCGDFLTASTGVDIYRNVIAMNSSDGIAIGSSGDLLIMNVGNPISENSIYGNGHKNISLDVYGGALANDDMDGDTGPNNWQNYPVITSIVQGSGQTTVNYTLNSTPGSNFKVEIFANSTGGPLVHAAEQYLGNTSPPATDASGNTSGTMTFSGLHDFISATAINTLTNDTSEISAILPLNPNPAVNVSRSTINFGNIPTGGSSATQSITLTSTGNVPYRINSLTASPSCYGGPICSTGDSGDFMCSTGTCATSTDYASGSSCTFNGTFAPNTLGPKSTTFYVCDNASGSPRAITFSGTGVVPPPINLIPSALNFGNVLVGSTSDPQVLTIANPGSGPLSIGPVTTTSNFSVVSTDCESSILPRSSCIAQIAFTPTLPGSLSGFASVAVGAGPSASASLSGTGTQAAALTLPTAIDLGSFLVGSTTPLTTVVELRNSGNAVLTLGNITLTGPFTLVNPCPINLSPGASCSLTLGFSTTTRGEFNGTLTVLSNALGGSRVIPVTARSQLVAAPLIKVTPSFLGFGDRLAGTPSAPQRVTVTNEGGVDAVLGPITTDVDFLVVSTTCGLTLAQSSTCFADVALRPVGFGPRVGVLRLTSNAAGSPHVVNLLGTGCRPFLATSNRLGTRSNCSP